MFSHFNKYFVEGITSTYTNFQGSLVNSRCLFIVIRWKCIFEVQHPYFGHLRPWAVFLSRLATLHVNLLHGSGNLSHRIQSYYRQVCCDTWLLVTYLLLRISSRIISGLIVGCTKGDLTLISFLPNLMLNGVCSKV